MMRRAALRRELSRWLGGSVREDAIRIELRLDNVEPGRDESEHERRCIQDADKSSVDPRHGEDETDEDGNSGEQRRLSLLLPLSRRGRLRGRRSGELAPNLGPEAPDESEYPRRDDGEMSPGEQSWEKSIDHFYRRQSDGLGEYDSYGKSLFQMPILSSPRD